MAAPNRPPNPNPYAASLYAVRANLLAANHPSLNPNPSPNPNPNPNPNHTIPHGILYPVPTRGHPPSGPPSVATLPTVAAGVNPAMYARPTAQVPIHHQLQHQQQQHQQQQQQQHRFVYAGNDVQHQQQHQVRPNVLPSFNVPRAAGTSGAPPLKGVPIATHAKGQALTNVAQTLEYMLGRDRDRDRNNDDTFVMINDRKVRLTDGGEPCSLYSLCRSWVRNGTPVETHPNYYGHSERILPRPLPASIADSDEVKKDDKKKQEENEDSANDEDGAAVEPYTTRSLLEEHIKRAKRIRAKLTKERLVRIRRYKQRLALLLPSTELANNAITAKLE